MAIRNTPGTSSEQRIQTIIQLVITALVGWGGITLVDLGKSVNTLQATTTLTTAQTTKDIADLKNGLEAVRTQALNATTAATTAAAVAATAVSTAAALAGTPKEKTPK